MKLGEFRDPSKEIGKKAEDLLRRERWDYVILQDHCSRPVRFRGSFLLDVHVLCKKIRSVGAVPVLFATWPYKPGYKDYEKFGLDYDSLADGLYDACHVAAEKEGIIAADVGQKFRELYSCQEAGSSQDIPDLYAEDGCNPSEYGSRIAAEVISRAIQEDIERRGKRQTPDPSDLLKDASGNHDAEDGQEMQEYYEYTKPATVGVKDTDNRIRVLYIYQILKKYSDATHPLTTNQIRSLLEKNYGLTMHRGTVANDIEALSAAGVKIKGRRSSQNQYFLAEGEFEMSELKILIDAVQSSRFITEEKCRDLVAKLKGLTNVQNVGKLKSNIHTSGRARSENEKGYEIVDTINDAINDGRQLSFFYTDINDEKRTVLRNDGKPYIVSPYTLIWNGDFYYLLGFDHAKEAMRTYRVDRILDRPEILKEKAEPAPEDLDIGRYTREVFSMYDSEEVQEVELLCSYSVMKYIVDQFGRDIKIKRAGKGWFGLTVSVCASPTFYSWVFQFGGNIKIKGPEEVKVKYREMLLKVLE
jgi:predicted DNA-binding transcriptional regulator YafY